MNLKYLFSTNKFNKRFDSKMIRNAKQMRCWDVIIRGKQRANKMYVTLFCYIYHFFAYWPCHKVVFSLLAPRAHA